MQRRKLIAGNWKMNGLTGDLAYFDVLSKAIRDLGDVDILVCPPLLLLDRAVQACADTGIMVGAQDCHMAVSGAHTGDVSASMLQDIGATHVILGHSERRADHGETDTLVKAKAEAALAAGLTPIICVGETLEDREQGAQEAVVGKQARDSMPDAGAGAVIIAYEPVWAIGTGRTASDEDIAAMHQFIRNKIQFGPDTLILYGGSVKPGNAEKILSIQDVDGALVGGASLDAGDFHSIIHSAR